ANEPTPDNVFGWPQRRRRVADHWRKDASAGPRGGRSDSWLTHGAAGAPHETFEEIAGQGTMANIDIRGQSHARYQAKIVGNLDEMHRIDTYARTVKGVGRLSRVVIDEKGAFADPFHFSRRC